MAPHGARPVFTVIGAGLTALVLVLGACDDGVQPDADGTARIQVLLTDAPADYLAVAEVCISQVYLQSEAEGEGEEEAGRTVLWAKGEGSAQCFDLLQLQGVTAQLMGPVEVPAGTYHQLRLVVESSTVTLKEGYTFEGSDEITRALSVPSGAQSGIKVQLAQPVFAEAATLTEITVDADVSQNFKIQGNPETPAGIKGVLFTPHLMEIARDSG